MYSKITSHRLFSKFMLVFVFISASVLFIFGGQISSRAQELGFTPQLIDSFNCVLGTGQVVNDTAQSVHLCEDNSGTGALSAIGSLTDTLYTSPPNSSIVWAYDQYNRLQNKELITVYAQDPGESALYFPGLGYNLLQPMLELWQWSRNLVYIFYVVIIIVIAFLILFRQSLGGQTTVSIANAVPSLILSLVLVTLSYPIAGFFVDLIYIGSNVVQSIMITSDSAPGSEFVSSEFLDITDRPAGASDINFLQPDDQAVSIWAIWGSSSSDILQCQPSPDDPDKQECFNNLIPQFVPENNSLLTFIGGIVPRVESAIESGLGTSTGSGLLNLVMGLAAFMAAFRLFMALLKNYVTLILAPIYLPWLFLSAAIPSRTKTSIVNALKPLLAASLSFIGVYALFLFIIIIGQSPEFSNGFQNAGEFAFTPPLLGYSPDQVTGEAAYLSSSVSRSLIIYILFLAAPTIPEMINGWLNVQGPGQIVSNAGQSTMSSIAKLGAGAAMLKGFSSILPGTAKKKQQ